MEASESMPDQNKEEGSQLNEVPPQGDEAVPPPTSDPKPSLQEATPKDALATEPFQPVLEALAHLDRDDPKLAFQGARLVGLYRRLWESCVSKHLDCEKTNEANQVLREASVHLSNERDSLQLRHAEQLSRLRFFDRAFQSSRERLSGILNDWNQLSRGDLADLVDADRRE
ncbi:hypothetical protein N7523_002085 [Penicillium sp. IBT 18751x]|nr:hypothetical protein N7523_002073 [Penicillium sp. IBT 18751x]KAJ6126473.1 hypothetical protein N7523_002085 [Penicillium sp. IBT 18751x]